MVTTPVVVIPVEDSRNKGRVDESNGQAPLILGLSRGSFSVSEAEEKKESSFSFALGNLEKRKEIRMRIIQACQITEAVKNLCVEANRELPPDLERLVREQVGQETAETAGAVLCDLCRNLDAARDMKIPICQDTGMAVVFAEVGQEVYIEGNFEEAVNLGVSRGYVEGLLRCSVVSDPLRRVNSGDNTPAVLHTRLVPGDKISLIVAPKGFGSENMSSIRMLTPAATEEDLIAYAVDTVRTAGGNPCPPVVLGVGIGGDFELCAYLAKKALCRSVLVRHPDPFYARLEEKMLEAVNRTGVGPQGFGGDTTALAVNIETFATHIAGLPVAINVGCHVTRHKRTII